MLSSAHDKPLFTPGPLTTSRTVKQAMLRDLGSRDGEFITLVKRIREELLTLGGASQETGYETVLMQGSGTFGIESVLSSVIPPDGTLLILINGAYGERMAKMANVLKIRTVVQRGPENRPVDVETLKTSLALDPQITHVAVVHCETTTGILNPVREIGEITKVAGKTYIVDSMSIFGATSTSLADCEVDYLISSANKCIEGVPGFAFVLCRRDSLLQTEGYARSLSLDLLAQWKGLEKDGQFRFTPPTHALLAFAQALEELKAEGGVEGRAARYHQNHETLIQGMRELGFREYIVPELQSDIITTYPYPVDAHFSFEAFYDRLNERGFVIYPGKLTNAECFRIGSIGRLFPSDMRDLLAAIREVLTGMQVSLPVQMSGL